MPGIILINQYVSHRLPSFIHPHDLLAVPIETARAVHGDRVRINDFVFQH
jgi:hypothetical protein